MSDDEHDQKNPWNRLVGAAREAGATEEDHQKEEAPSTFVSRVVKMREGLWQFAKTVLWRRWSAIAALIAILLYLLFHFVMKMNPPEPAPNPSLPLPPEP